jgi:Bacteriocin-protection, YdeI or OmpD-Associated/Domain of unknown function (DUF1905)
MSFSAEVLSGGQGGGHAVVVPKEVAAQFSSKRPAVVAHINGVEYRSRLAVYGGQSYLGLRKDLLRTLEAGVGDVVEVELVEDHQERVVVEEPPELTAALAEHPAAKAAYERLPSSHRTEYARWIGEAKKPETRADRVAKTIKRLTEPR